MAKIVTKKIVALVPELFFASKVEATLVGVGYDVKVLTRVDQVKVAVGGGADLLIVDLASGLVDLDTISAELEALKNDRLKVLGFFSHVQPKVRKRALEADFDLVVPRSRMAREMPNLVNTLLEG